MNHLLLKTLRKLRLHTTRNDDASRARSRLITHAFAKPIHQQTVVVIGLGYVGLPLALRVDTAAARVVGIDTDKEKIAALRRREAPYITEEENRYFQHESEVEMSYYPSAIRDADTVIICVPTPVSTSHQPDLSALERACTSIGMHIRPNTLVIVESTVNPGVCEEVVIPSITSRSGLSPVRDIFFAHCPERINPGDTKWNIRTIPRVVGSNTQEGLRRACAFYQAVLEAPVHPLASLKEAEAVKMVENAFRDINIAFVNELAMSFDKLGIDVVEVINAAASKPFGFMPHYPGCGVGGHCIPIDPYYLITYAARNGFHHHFLKTARAINNTMPAYTISLTERALHKHGKKLSGSTVALLGMAYKANIPDTRESPALKIREQLTERGVHVRTHDPYVSEQSTAGSIAEAVDGADATIVATAHHVFCNLSPSDLRTQQTPIIIDGRNCLAKKLFVDEGMTYLGIGR